MSNAIFPTLPGLGIEVTKELEFSTLIQRSATGRELRVSERAYPLYYHTLRFNFLRDTAAFPELRSLMGFFGARQGDADNFLFVDPDDSSVTDQAIGTGTGSQTDFQLARSFGSFTEPIYEPNTITNVRVNGSGASYTNQGSGVVRITPAPGAGATVTWTGTFYYRSRFKDRSLSVEKFLHQVWQGRSVALVSSLQNKI